MQQKLLNLQGVSMRSRLWICSARLASSFWIDILIFWRCLWMIGGGGEVIVRLMRRQN